MPSARSDLRSLHTTTNNSSIPRNSANLNCRQPKNPSSSCANERTRSEPLLSSLHDASLSDHSSIAKTPAILPDPDVFDPLRLNNVLNDRLFFTHEWNLLGNIAYGYFQPLNIQDINNFVGLPPSNTSRELALELPSASNDTQAMASMNALLYTERLINALLPADPEQPGPGLPTVDHSFHGLEPHIKEVLLENGLINEEPSKCDQIRQLQWKLRSTKDETAILFGRIADGAAKELRNQQMRRARKLANDELEISYMRSQLNKHKNNRKKFQKTQLALYRNFHHYPSVREEYTRNMEREKERKANKNRRVSMATHTRAAKRKRVLESKNTLIHDDDLRNRKHGADVDTETEGTIIDGAGRKRNSPITLRLPLKQKKKGAPLDNSDHEVASIWVNDDTVPPSAFSKTEFALSDLHIPDTTSQNKKNSVPEADIEWWAVWCGANGGLMQSGAENQLEGGKP